MSKEDYSLKEFKEWLETQKNPMCGKIVIMHTELLITKFEKEQEKPQYEYYYGSRKINKCRRAPNCK